MLTRLLAIVSTLAFVAPGPAARASEHGVPDVQVIPRAGISPPVRSLPRAPVGVSGSDVLVPERLTLPGRTGAAPARAEPAPKQRSRAPEPKASITTPTVFEGIKNADHDGEGVGRRVPPDVHGDVGPDHYVQATNTLFAIYNKDGSVATAPALISSMWAGGADDVRCDSHDQGDPIVLYDDLAERWLITQFAWERTPSGPTGPFYECVAVSTTDDPTGAYFLYEILVHDTIFPDYPKIGVWPDGYYFTFNQFDSDGDFRGARIAVLERDAVLLGATANFINPPQNDLSLGGMLPADLDGLVLPPAGAPNYIAQFDKAGPFNGDRLRVFGAYVTWDPPTLSLPLMSTIDLSSRGFPIDNSLCPTTGDTLNCIPQHGTSIKVDALADRLLWRMQYRNFGTHETLLVNHTVDVGGNRAGIRWYEIRDPANGGFHQGGTYAPSDQAHRWMGSLAMDVRGNIALGYSHSNPSASTYPSIGITGRAKSDPVGTMTVSEEIVQDGGGAQTGDRNRWGDYTSMSVDPTDGCTFWYTNQYYPASSSDAWHSAIASFQIDGCTAVSLGSISGTVRRNGVGVAGATVHAGTLSTITGAGGSYSFDAIPPGTYTITARAPKRGPRSITRAVGAGGSVTGADIALGPAKRIGADFNGDGYADLAIGAPKDRHGRRAGAVTVLSGGPRGLKTGGDDLLHQNISGVPGRSQHGDFFGAALATGDFNGDGFDDLAVGAHGEDIGSARNAGAVTVFPGSRGGIRPARARVWHQNSAGVRDRSERGDSFGFALAAGDFDRDGRDDLAVGVPGENGDRGAVSVLFGSRRGLSARDQLLTEATRGVLGASERGDNFGDALAAGHFNGDRYADLAIGSSLEDLGGKRNTGAVHVLYGRRTGLSARGDQLWHQNVRGIADVNNHADRYGTRVAAGDMNGDGVDELVIGIPGEDVAGRGSAGAVSVIYGTSRGLRARGDDFFTRATAGVADTAGGGDRFGMTLAVGDVDADGREDLAVGAPFDRHSGEAQAGSLQMFFGGAGGLTVAGDEVWTQHQVGGSSAEDGDGFALGLAAGDFNADGFADLALGVPGEDTFVLGDFGVVHEVPGSPRGPDSLDADLWHQDVPGIASVARTEELFGFALAS